MTGERHTDKGLLSESSVVFIFKSFFLSSLFFSWPSIWLLAHSQPLPHIHPLPRLTTSLVKLGGFAEDPQLSPYSFLFLSQTFSFKFLLLLIYSLSSSLTWKMNTSKVASKLRQCGQALPVENTL